MSSGFRRQLVLITGFVERYLLSAMYLWLAWRQLDSVWRVLNISAGVFSLAFVVQVRETILFFVQFFIGLLLLISQRPTEPPRRLREVLVPLATSVYFLLYFYLVPSLPGWLTAPYFPAQAVRIPCAIAALFLGLAGSVLSVAGVICLGRSFGIFVSVREIVYRGPYRHVRHPIYSGYLLLWAALVLSTLSIAYLVLVLVHTGLLIYRARLEEQRLAESSPQYRAYMARTGFLLPKLGGPEEEIGEERDKATEA